MQAEPNRNIKLLRSPINEEEEEKDDYGNSDHRGRGRSRSDARELSTSNSGSRRLAAKQRLALAMNNNQVNKNIDYPHFAEAKEKVTTWKSKVHERQR